MIRRLFSCPECDNRMTYTQTLLGWFYLPLHLFLLPLFIGMFAFFTRTELSGVFVNELYFGTGTVFVLLVMGEWLRRNFYVLLDRPGRFALCLAVGFAADYVMSLAVQLVLMLVPGAVGNPNNAELAELAGSDYSAMAGLSVFLAPMVEETLFRGVVFGTIRRKSRTAAYAVSALLFALLHVWQYALIDSDPWYFIYMLQYLPVSLVLAWQYERSGSIWTPIAFHMLINVFSFYVLTRL